MTFDLWGRGVLLEGMLTMPRVHPREFRDDVVAVARKGEAPVAERQRLWDIGVVPAELVACS